MQKYNQFQNINIIKLAKNQQTWRKDWPKKGYFWILERIQKSKEAMRKTMNYMSFTL